MGSEASVLSAEDVETTVSPSLRLKKRASFEEQEELLVSSRQAAQTASLAPHTPATTLEVPVLCAMLQHSYSSTMSEELPEPSTAPTAAPPPMKATNAPIVTGLYYSDYKETIRQSSGQPSPATSVYGSQPLVTASGPRRVTAFGPVPCPSAPLPHSVLARLLEPSISRRPVTHGASSQPALSISASLPVPPASAHLRLASPAQSPTTHAAAASTTHSRSHEGIGVALSLVASEVGRRASATAQHERLRHETEARRQRLDARRRRVAAEEEQAAADETDAKQAAELAKWERCKAERDVGRQRMRAKAIEREGAKAAALVRTMRKQVRLEQRRLVAALRVQACVRRWLARATVQRRRSLRMQRQLCAQQAAWRAKGRLLSADANATGVPE